MSKNILITGGAGYIGAALAESLIKEGHKITIIDSLMHNNWVILYGLDQMISKDLSIEDILIDNFSKKNLDKKFKKFKNFDFIEMDIRDKDKLEKIFSEKKFDFVFHFAELIGHFACEHDPKLTESINYHGSKSVIDLAIKNNSTLIWNSSTSIYGFRKNPGLLTENDGWPSKKENMDNYCLNKLRIEEYISKKSKEYPNFRYAIFRPATVGGLGLRTRIDLLPNFFPWAAVVQKRIELAQPEDYRAFIHIDDLIDVYKKLIKLLGKNWINGVYNIGSINLTRGEFAEHLSKLTDFEVIHKKDTVVDPRSLQISSDKLINYIGFKPKSDLGRMVKPLIEIVKKYPEIFINSKNKQVNKVFINTPLEDFNKLIKS